MRPTLAPMPGAVLLVAVIALGLSGCGAADDEMARPPASASVAPMPLKDLADLPVGIGEVGPAHQVRSQGSRLVVDGRATDLAPMRVDELAVVLGGVFFRNGSELWFTDLDRARGTGYHDARSLVASADGRRLAFLDLEHGPKDRFGTPLAMAVAYDATTGRPLVASYAGMGGVADDLAGLYAEAEPRILRFDGDTLLVHGASGGDYQIPLDGEAAERVPAPAG